MEARVWNVCNQLSLNMAHFNTILKPFKKVSLSYCRRGKKGEVELS